MPKLLTIFAIVIFFAASPEPENLTLDEPGENVGDEPEELVLGDAGSTDEPLLPFGAAELEIITKPPRVMVYIDGERLGVTPFDGKPAEYGEHYLSFRKRGYLPYEKDIAISGDGPTSLLLPMVRAPSGYEESLRDAELSTGVLYEFEIISFRKWLHADERRAADLAEIADNCTRLASCLEESDLYYDAMRCRNAAAGFHLLLELAAGTPLFADDPSVSTKVAERNRHKALSNEKALIELTESCIEDLGSEDADARALAAHSLRHTYSVADASSMAIDALEAALEGEPDEFIRLVITEAIEQITYEPEGM